MIKLLKFLWTAFMGLFRSRPSLPTAIVVKLPDVVVPETKPIAIPEPVKPAPVPTTDLGAPRSLIVPDVYPPDLDNPHTPEIDLPPFQALVGLTVSGHEVAGCYVKASEGLGWGAKNEAWFVDCWRAMQNLHILRGCYHFLRFSIDGAKQADYLYSLIQRAGGFDGSELVTMLDIEEGGQGAWAGGERLEAIADAAKRARLAGEIRTCATAFIKRWRELMPGHRICVYGRGVFRDLQMASCMFGADTVANPAYTVTMPRMEQYGVPLDKIGLWQLCGDGTVFCPGFPGLLPGWGKTDYSVHIAGAGATSWKTFFRECMSIAR